MVACTSMLTCAGLVKGAGVRELAREIKVGPQGLYERGQARPTVCVGVPHALFSKSVFHLIVRCNRAALGRRCGLRPLPVPLPSALCLCPLRT